MSRELTPEMRAETVSDCIRPARFVELDFPGRTVRLWSGVGPLWGYVGIGSLGQISVISETADLRAPSITIQIAGLLADRFDYVRELLSADLDRCMATVEHGYLDSRWLAVPWPIVIFRGYMDMPEFEDAGETYTVSITVESRLLDLERPRIRRYTDADQRSRFPGDRGCEYIPAIQEVEIPWGTGLRSV